MVKQPFNMMTRVKTVPILKQSNRCSDEKLITIIIVVFYTVLYTPGKSLGVLPSFSPGPNFIELLNGRFSAYWAHLAIFFIS